MLSCSTGLHPAARDKPHEAIAGSQLELELQRERQQVGLHGRVSLLVKLNSVSTVGVSVARADD
jgi:hypothetical protein